MIEFLEDEIEMYDMEVEDVHCFYANGVLVHNCSQEMVLMANFSNEPNLINPLLQGEDIHKYVGTKMFGHYDKSHRTIAKTINFACPTDECLIHTRHGLIRPSMLVSDVIDQYGNIQEVIRNEEFIGNAIRIHYSNGCVESYHEDHKVQILTKEGRVWKKVKELTVTDEVLYCPDMIRSEEGEWYEHESDYILRRKSDKKYDFCSEPFAYLMGLYLGDGSINGTTKSMSISWVVNSDCDKLFIEACRRLEINPRVSKQSNLWTVYMVNNNAFVKAVLKYFGRTKGKTVPDKAYQEWSHNEWRYFLAGLIDSDGDASATNVCFVNTNLALINKVAPVANAMGIPTKLSECKSSVTFYRLWFMHTRELPIQTCHRQQPKRRWSCERFASHLLTDEACKVIAPMRYKNAHYDNVIRGKSPIYPTDVDIRYAQGTMNVLTTNPIKIEEIGEQKCYCIEVKGHEYLTAVVSHNSNYGASGYTIGKRLGKSTEEGQALLDKYNSTMSKLCAWKQEMIKEGRRKGIVYTYFGRPRAVWMYYQSSDRSKHSFGDRTCMNSPVQGCLPGFTKVLTRSGYKSIVEVDNEEVWNGVAWTFAQLVPKGRANLVRLTTEDGNVLYCDDRHMLKDENYQWVNVMNLKPGDRVCLNNEDSGTITDSVDFFYYLMGYITGDGDVTEKWREDQKCWRTEVVITFGSHEKERLDFIKFKLKELGYNPHVRENIHKPNNKESVRYQLCVYGHDIVEKLKSYGMVPNERAHTKHVPKSVWSTGAKSFLRGLYESDGCKGQNSWHMTNPDLLEEVSLLLNQAGFSTRISKTRNAYKLMVRGNGLGEWLYSDTKPRCYRRDEVLPHHISAEIIQYLPHDASSASVIRRRIEKGGSCSMKFIGDQGLTVSEYYSTSRVKSVERLAEVQDMYTLATVHPLHQFVTEGFISKNTGGDIIRLDYIKYQSSIDPKSKTYDKGFAENTLHALTVHDEINLFVKPEYVPQAFNKLRSIMELSFPNWKVPLKVSPSVGMDWGHQIECLGFTEDGTMIPDCEEDISLL